LWALPLYTAAYLGAAASGLLSLEDPGRLMAAMALATFVYGLAAYRFRLRGWLMAASITAQFTMVAFILWRGLPGEPAQWPIQLALAFTPVTWATALAGLAVQRLSGEGASFKGSRGGWSPPSCF
jgi:hypothetical protein